MDFGTENSSGFGGAEANNYVTTSSRCHVKIFSFKDRNPKPDSIEDENLKVNIIDLASEKIDNPITSFSYTKSNSNASGYFQFVLMPTANWLELIKPGDWVVVYLSNGWHQDQLRCFGTIDCVNMSETIDTRSGSRVITYNVSGRDFGKVFEKYMVYINIFLESNIAQNELLKFLLIQDTINVLEGGPDVVVKDLLKIFLGGAADQLLFADQQQLKQWRIPTELVREIQGGQGQDLESSGGAKFLDLLNLDHIQSGLDGVKIVTTLDVRAPLWQFLQSHANLLINEMFCEMDENNKPSVYLRTIPFTFKDYTDPAGLIDGNLVKFLDLPVVNIEGKIILASDIGLHENDRVNFLILTSTFLDMDSGNPNSSLAYLTGKFPYVNAASCQRYGLNVFEYRTDYALKQGGTMAPDPNLLQSWNYLLKHWYENNALFEHANLTIVGRPDVRLGKRAEISKSPLLLGVPDGVTKSYYIEAYVDSWEYGKFWTQSLTLTRGVFVDGGQEKYVHELYSKNPIAPVGLSISRRVPMGGFD